MQKQERGSALKHTAGMKNKIKIGLLIVMSCMFVSCASTESESMVEETMTENTTMEESVISPEDEWEQEAIAKDTLDKLQEAEESEPDFLEAEEMIDNTQESETVEPYPLQVALDYVEKPQKRTRAEAIEKIKELSLLFPQLVYVAENEEVYPDGLLTSVANNPEMTDFVCGYPDADGSVTDGFTAEELEQEYPLFLQFDPRWGYYPYGITVMADSGCGPTCLSMAVFYLTRDATVTPDVVGQYSMDNGYYVTNVGTAWGLLTDYPAIHGLHSSTLSVSKEAMNQKLEEGNILICSMRPGNFTAGGHFVVVYGVDETGYKVNDPKCVYRSNQSWSYEELSADIKRIWCVGRL